MRDRSLGTAVQTEVSNHLKVMLLIVMVLNIEEKTKQKILSDVYYGDELK